MDAPHTVTRLTAREKEALRGWLDHKTAKEIALDLGISHYAVEKRLKAARLKLGVTSSLDAARLLAAQEEYGQAVAQAAELDDGMDDRQFQPPTNRKLGSVAMLTLSAAAIALAFAYQATSDAGGPLAVAVDQAAAPAPTGHPSVQDLEFVPATPERVEAYVRQLFDAWDRDRSGFVELAEAPDWLSVPRAAPGGSGEQREMIELTGNDARAQYIANVDADGDGKVSFAEYALPVRPQYLARGIPLIPADWVPAGSETTATPLEPAVANGRVVASPVEMRLAIATSFAHLDADRSGFIDGSEGVVNTPQAPAPILRQGDAGRLIDSGERVTRSIAWLNANFYRTADTDGDRRVSPAEFEPWAASNLQLTGLAADHRQALNAPIGPQS